MPTDGTASRRRRPKGYVGSGAVESPSPSLAEYYSKAIGRALEVLNCFKDAETSLTLMDLSKLRGFPESSLFRILLTLEAHRYLMRSPDGAYRLASKVLFGMLHERAQEMREVVHPFLKQLVSRFNETAGMGFLFQDRIEVIDTLEAIQEIRRANTLGRVLPPHCSSIGKAIVAFQDRPTIERILRINGLAARTDKTVTDQGKLLAEFETIRQKGHAVDREESVLGGICIGAPLFNDRGRAVAAISLSVPAFRMNPKREAEMVAGVVETARAASAAIAAGAEPAGGEPS